MRRPPAPLFLERRTYRRRRLTDAAYLLPVLGLLLLLGPLLFAPEPGSRTATASVTIYVFGVWAGLIVLAAVIARRLSRPGSEGAEPRGREQAE